MIKLTAASDFAYVLFPCCSLPKFNLLISVFLYHFWFNRLILLMICHDKQSLYTYKLGQTKLSCGKEDNYLNNRTQWYQLLLAIHELLLFGNTKLILSSYTDQLFTQLSLAM